MNRTFSLIVVNSHWKLNLSTLALHANSIPAKFERLSTKLPVNNSPNVINYYDNLRNIDMNSICRSTNVVYFSTNSQRSDFDI